MEKSSKINNHSPKFIPVIARKYWPFSVSVSDLKQNSAFGCTLAWCATIFARFSVNLRFKYVR